MKRAIGRPITCDCVLRLFANRDMRAIVTARVVEIADDRIAYTDAESYGILRTDLLLFFRRHGAMA